MQLLDVVGRLEVEHDRALVAVLAVEVERGDAVRSVGRAHDARIVAAVGLPRSWITSAPMIGNSTPAAARQALADFDHAIPSRGNVTHSFRGRRRLRRRRGRPARFRLRELDEDFAKSFRSGRGVSPALCRRAATATAQIGKRR